MAADEDAFYGFAEVITPAHKWADEAGKPKALAHMQQLLLWSTFHRNLETVRKTVKGKHASTTVVLNPAPEGYGVHAHPLARKMLLLTGIKDCDTKISGREGDHINMAKAIDKALLMLTF